MGTLDHFVESYPGFSLLILLVFQGILVWLWRSLKWFVRREFAAMEKHQSLQDTSIGHIEQRLNHYDITFAVSQRSFDELVGKIDAHIKKEEDLPLKVQEIADDVGWIKSYMVNGKNKS